MLRTCLAVLVSLTALSCVPRPDPDDIAQHGFRTGRPLAEETIFSALDLPTPNRLRTGAGTPGPDYWQQQADYTINATLDEPTRTITAACTLAYTNNSPEQLEYLWLHLEQNLYRHGSVGERMTEPDTRFANRAGFRGGFNITAVTLAGDVPDKGTALPFRIHDALMRIDLPKPCGSRGGKVAVQVSYTFLVPDYGSDRMGIEKAKAGDVFEIAQWFPAICKYDDVRGWNTLPYLGQGEFYTDFGSFDVNLTVPREHIVAATGVLQNPLSVLTDTQIERLNKARASKETVLIVAPDEVGKTETRPAPAASKEGEAASPSTLTWHFKAERVRTFAWASSRAFIWDAAFAPNAGKETNGKREGTLCMSVYPAEGLPLWANSTQMLRHSIEHYGLMWFVYPYPSATNVNGIVGGMEYPMIIFCEERIEERGLFGVTTHEIGHNWFPMTVNTDERRHAWMDEGFNTFINQYAVQSWFGGTLDILDRRPEMTMRMRKPDQQPIDTPADQVLPKRLGFLQYRKVATAMVLLREVVLGPSRFDPAFRRYINTWAFKSPQPADFFRCMEDAAGSDLAWFWRGWFFSTGTLDQSVDSVTQTGTTATLRFSSRGRLVMPVPYRLHFSDGTIEDRAVPVEAWFTSDRVTQHIDLGTPDEAEKGEKEKGAGETSKGAAARRRITRVEIDPEGYLPDTDLSNNRWPR
ncbi:MAG: M1 family metallopeptidase [Phycisphaerales bacterium]